MNRFYRLSAEMTGHDPGPEVVLPGSFNPLHDGHLELASIAGRLLGKPVAFELSIANVDKPELPPEEVERRLSQFDPSRTVWITRAATFAEKARLFPGCIFVIGHDTAVRLFDLKYYRGSLLARHEALIQVREQNCRFLVGGRIDRGGQFHVWSPSLAPPEFQDLLWGLSESEFRRDISSTELRMMISSEAL